jgi:hypothetical protein
MKLKYVALAGAGIAAITLFVFIGGTAVQLLWNWLLPALFGVPEVTFWQALGVLALSRILFGGLGGGGRSKREPYFKDEDKERFARRVRERFHQRTQEAGGPTATGQTTPDGSP